MSVDADVCAACGCPLHQHTLIGVAAVPRAPAPEPAADQTVLGPPRPEAPSWAQVPMAAPTLLDSQASFRAVTPAGGHPALPRTIPEQEHPPAPAPARPPKASTRPDATPRRGPRTIAADHMHHAVAQTRVQAAQERRGRRRSSLLIGLAGIAVAVAVVAYATRFRAELVDTFQVTRTSSGYAVAAGLKTSGPAMVHHPGGATPVDGSALLRFELPASALALGDNPVQLRVVGDGGGARALTLHVMVYYQRQPPPMSPPRNGVPVDFDLEVQPGWTAALRAPGEVTAIDATHLRLSVLPDAAIRAARPGAAVVLPIPFELRAPDGTAYPFTERVHLPPSRAQPR